MADDAFALSPISARPTPPSEADYEAIRAAFVETSRGRWFLGEYARRNRNADTTMVLDAVARIEQSIAAKPQPTIDLRETISTIKTFITAAQADAANTLVTIEHSAELASARKSARVIREIAWSLRECGTDARICDILDAQVRGIDALHELAGSSRQVDAVVDAFDRLLIRIDGLAGDDIETRPAPASTPATTIDAAADHTALEVANKVSAPTAPFDPPPVAPPAPPNETSLADVALADIAFPDDEEVLGLVADEMSAPQDDMFDGDDGLPAGDPIVALKELAPEAVAAAVARPEPLTAAAPPLQPDSRQPDASSSSLGAALIASGVVRTPTGASSDPLAAIRRLSQAEKIALFS